MPATIHNLINNASTTVSGSVTDSATSLTVGTALSVTAPFLATFADTGEIIRVGTASGTAWSNITRGYDGTTAASHASGTALELRLTAQHMTERRPYNVYPQATAAATEAAINAAIADGYLSFAPATYQIGGAGRSGALFTITTAMQVEGNGALLEVHADTPNTVDIFHVKPTTKIYNGSFRGLNIWPNVNGPARHALHLEGTGNGHIISYGVSDCMFGKDPWVGGYLGGAAIKVTNQTDNVYRLRIQNTQVNGHVIVDKAGDSFLFEALNVHGANFTAIDVQDMVVGAGILTIRDCNLIGGQGSLRVKMNGPESWNCCRIENIDSDYVTTYANPQYGSAACYIEGGRDNVVRDSRFNCQSATGRNVHALRLFNCIGSSVYGNQLCKSGTGKDLVVEGDTITDPEVFYWGGNYVGHNYLHTNTVTNTDPDPRAAL